MMKKSLKRLLNLLREKAGGRVDRERTSVRGGVQQPQRMHASDTRTDSRS